MKPGHAKCNRCNDGNGQDPTADAQKKNGLSSSHLHPGFCLKFPIAQSLGIDPLHLGAVIVLNVAIGMVTPPFGLNLFVGVVTFRVPFLELSRSMLPFIGISLIALMLVTYVPLLVTWLPRFVGL